MSNNEDLWKTHKNEIEKILSEIKVKDTEIINEFKKVIESLNSKKETMNELFSSLQSLMGEIQDDNLDNEVESLESAIDVLSNAIEDDIPLSSDVSYECDEISTAMAEAEVNGNNKSDW